MLGQADLSLRKLAHFLSESGSSKAAARALRDHHVKASILQMRRLRPEKGTGSYSWDLESGFRAPCLEVKSGSVDPVLGQSCSHPPPPLIPHPRFHSPAQR